VLKSFGDKQHHNKNLFPFLLIVPSLALLLAVNIFPLIYSLFLSFESWSLVKPGDRSFVGLRNYVEVLTNPAFAEALNKTLIFTAVAIISEFLIGFALAVALSHNLKGVGAIRSVILMPLVMTPVVTGLVWRFMYNPEYGMINYFLNLLGISTTHAWLGDTSTALPAVILVDVWENTPFVFLILLAGLQALPREPFEAAQIDGASRWTTLTCVTLPLLKPAILVALLIRTVDALKVFDIIYVMTMGGPAAATETLSILTYRFGFLRFDMGYTAALSYIIVLIIVLASQPFVRSFFVSET